MYKHLLYKIRRGDIGVDYGLSPYSLHLYIKIYDVYKDTKYFAIKQ